MYKLIAFTTLWLVPPLAIIRTLLPTDKADSNCAFVAGVLALNELSFPTNRLSPAEEPIATGVAIVLPKPWV